MSRDGKRNRNISFNVTAEEYEDLRERSDLAGLTLAAYIRAILDHAATEGLEVKTVVTARESPAGLFGRTA